MILFLSHAAVEGELAKAMKGLIEQAFAGRTRVFLAKDDIETGHDWLKTIESTLETCRALLVCCSPSSIHRPWINYELGWATQRGIPVIPLCYAGMVGEKLPMQLRRFQALTIEGRKFVPELIGMVRGLGRVSRGKTDLAKQFERVRAAVERVDPWLHAGGWLSRLELVKLIGPLESFVDRARREIRISGADCKYVFGPALSSVEKALRRGVRVKVMCVDPDSGAAEMLPQVDRFRSTDHFRESLHDALREAAALKQRFGRLFHCRLVPVLPAVGLVLCDPGSAGGLAKVEICAPIEPAPSSALRPDSRPHLVAPREWRPYVVQLWERYWKLGKPLAQLRRR
jgi:hypothetical protein